MDGGPFLFKGHVTTTSALDNENSDDGIDITDAARTYLIKATFVEGESGGCRVATVAEVPFFPGPFAMALGVAGVLATGLILVRRRK